MHTIEKTIGESIRYKVEFIGQDIASKSDKALVKGLLFFRVDHEGRIPAKFRFGDRVKIFGKSLERNGLFAVKDWICFHSYTVATENVKETMVSIATEIVLEIEKIYNAIEARRDALEKALK